MSAGRTPPTARETRSEGTAENAKNAERGYLCDLGELRGSIFGTCWASIPTLAGKKPDGRAWFALAIFAIALLVRLVHVWLLRRSPFFSVLMGDSRGDDEWAR